MFPVDCNGDPMLQYYMDHFTAMHTFYSPNFILSLLEQTLRPCFTKPTSAPSSLFQLHMTFRFTSARHCCYYITRQFPELPFCPHSISLIHSLQSHQPRVHRRQLDVLGPQLTVLSLPSNFQIIQPTLRALKNTLSA